MDEKQIIRNIETIPQNKKMSLERLAKLTGLTKGYISKIENSAKTPPFSTLNKIANALNTDVNLLIAQDSNVPEDISPCIIKKNETREVVSRGALYGYHYKALAYKKLGKNMEPYIIEPAFEEKAIFSHEDGEFMHIIEGTQEFVYDGKNI